MHFVLEMFAFFHFFIYSTFQVLHLKETVEQPLTVPVVNVIKALRFQGKFAVITMLNIL